MAQMVSWRFDSASAAIKYENMETREIFIQFAYDSEGNIIFDEYYQYEEPSEYSEEGVWYMKNIKDLTSEEFSLLKKFDTESCGLLDDEVRDVLAEREGKVCFHSLRAIKGTRKALLVTSKETREVVIDPDNAYHEELLEELADKYNFDEVSKGYFVSICGRLSFDLYGYDESKVFNNSEIS